MAIMAGERRAILRGVAATLIFFLLNAEQSGFWFTFAPIPDITKMYYEMGDFELNLLATWGPVMYLLVMPMAGKVAARAGGTYRVARIGVSLCFASALIRTLSQVMHAPRLLRRIVVHIAAIINACGGPLAMGMVSQAAVDYVPLPFQSTAVGVMYLGQNLGNALQGLLSPALVHNVDTMYRVSVAQTFISAGVLFLTFGLLPRSQVNNLQQQPTIVLSTGSATGLPPADYSYWHLARSKHMWILGMSGVLTAGFIAGQGALLPQFLTMRAPHFHSFTDLAAGQVNFGQSLMLCVGNVLGGVLADACCSKRLSSLACGAKAVSAVLILVLALAVPLSTGTAPLVPAVPKALVAFVVVVQGMFDGICDPLNYQLAALVTHPAPSALSAAVMTSAFNFAALVVLVVVPLLGSATFVNWIVLGTNVVAAVCYLLLEEAHHRRAIQYSIDSLKPEELTEGFFASQSGEEGAARRLDLGASELPARPPTSRGPW